MRLVFPRKMIKKSLIFRSRLEDGCLSEYGHLLEFLRYIENIVEKRRNCSKGDKRS